MPTSETLFARRTADLPEKKPPAACPEYPESLGVADVAFLDTIFACSPYLLRLARQRESLLRDMVSEAPEILLDRFEAGIRAAGEDAVSEDVLGQSLRRLKGDAHLVLALSELSGAMNVMDAARRLSAIADACVRAALRGLTRLGAVDGKFDEVADSENPLPGVFILALGKLGAEELNFSSDIDLVAYFDPEQLTPLVADNPGKVLQRLIKSLSRLLNDVTADGYVFRVDLRLRPDPSATPPIMSVNAAMNYYESLGQNWERAAYIKARYCAGDPVAANDFLSSLKPFVWRRTLDYAAVEDIHSLARQIQAIGDRARIRAAGHDLKLGRGGIREIEFYAQIPQLVMGGRLPELRNRSPYGALSDLAAAGVIETPAAEELGKAYRTLRKVEHRIQMVADEQTQTLPASDDKRSDIAILSGMKDVAALDEQVSDTLQGVHRHFSQQFASGQSLADDLGSLVFTGVEPTAETIETLSSLGFQFPETAWTRMNAWLAGKARALRTTRARQVLTRVAPRLLRAMADTGEPDSAFTRFAAFIEGLPMGVQPLSMLENEPDLARELVAIIGLAPRMATTLAQRPAAIDVMLDARFSRPLKDDPPGDVEERMAFQMAESTGPEDAMNRARRLVREERFRIGSQLLVGRADAGVAGNAFARLAEIAVAAMKDVALAQVVERYGKPPGEVAILGLGKLGSRELAADSDLDLMIIYDPAADAGDEAPPYFTRFAQRFVSALSSPTEEGSMYETDMQLRPSGKAGPVAVRLSSFEDYYRDSAWTWEKMALTRARVITGSAELIERINANIESALSQPADPAGIVTDALDMRRRMERDRPAKGPWDLKRRAGGIIDIEFLAQTGQLLLAQTNQFVRGLDTISQVDRLCEATMIHPEEAELLTDAARLWSGLSQIVRTAHGSGFDPESASNAFSRRLAHLAGQESLPDLSRHVEASAIQVRSVFENCLGNLQSAATDTRPRFVSWCARSKPGD
ncbi:bifunctional [glutamine synthetase] adenylyltransferase/[glutamine synthetase]-adenylyl-L-tyrosine phosphorylase [Hyphobacterium sp. HN65]|uniref:Bifunctional [glutamine synthetase] adenylyltransferase/[glutamine synthetase]-adenylyl-L-tyrosine phosphorylase n=1 Tax=Hyphobacterium lacteum TaxID=3116575 RepID=A0ABU7LT27_9PROT|nr:bifunctional [glutamine synthetase] adenylyltransferase/[glutamine synthetase]-adenylyl-L-tyrosine phosphorylase [Hyphobacterium sp. HN65]MEE2527072.1 bifunctional [glutamine synthetase] adenylyltransferase/[glutamine synthetase]-adenylyl-L-tyrosine phosphorylase [Hyphobacterium sp. HN65]